MGSDLGVVLSLGCLGLGLLLLEVVSRLLEGGRLSLHEWLLHLLLGLAVHHRLLHHLLLLRVRHLRLRVVSGGWGGLVAVEVFLSVVDVMVVLINMAVAIGLSDSFAHTAANAAEAHEENEAEN